MNGVCVMLFFFQAEDGIRDLVRSRGLGDVYKRQGYDAGPVYTPDGKYLLFRSQERATFEADRWRIMRYNPQSGEIVELTRGFDPVSYTHLTLPTSDLV